MTQVWPVLGWAPVPTFVSSYWRPLGVFCIFDSPFFSFSPPAFAFSSPDAGSAARVIAAMATTRNDAVLFIGSVSFQANRAFPLRRAGRIMTEGNFPLHPRSGGRGSG